MAVVQVQPRPTPEERADTAVEVELDDRLADWASAVEDWAARFGGWEFRLREGHDFGRADNVEAEVLYSAGGGTSSVTFRLDQVSALTQLGDELALVFEERDGIAKAARLTPTGLSVELFHIVTFT
jgi:hypothetical protein